MDSESVSRLVHDTIQRHGETRVIMTSAVDVSELGEIPAEARLPTPHGDFRIRVFHEDGTGFDHVALTLGDMAGPNPVLVRV